MERKRADVWKSGKAVQARRRATHAVYHTFISLNVELEMGKVDKRPSFPPIRLIIGLAYPSYDFVLTPHPALTT
ncbi:MAG TPA: hypothetical protein PKV33_10795 [Methanothrix sp.]|nr:hypothetical protein [Methanothrix sp.]